MKYEPLLKEVKLNGRVNGKDVFTREPKQDIFELIGDNHVASSSETPGLSALAC